MTQSPALAAEPRDAQEAFADLFRWIASRSQRANDEQTEGEGVDPTSSGDVSLADSDSSSSRGLVSSRDVPLRGETVIIRLPWSCAITPTSVLRSPSLKRLLPGPRLLALRDLLRGNGESESLLPHPWSLLLALGLLCEFADPQAPRRRYASLLPTPPGTPISNAAPFGPAATDVLLFEERELEALCCEPLAEAARKERRRLSKLHEVLFGGGEDEGSPSVSLVSFLWAHSLVRSRALDLRVVSAGESGPRGEVCLLPLIDLAQHSDGKRGSPKPATLRLVSSSSSSDSPSAVELVLSGGGEESDKILSAGSPVCLDYGSRPLRDLLRGYAFVGSPANATEVYEDFCSKSLSGRAALVADASRSVRADSLPRLTSVRLLSEPGGRDAALERGRARVVFVVAVDESGSGGERGSGGVFSGVAVSAEGSENDDGDRELFVLEPESETGICLFVASECEELASAIEGFGKAEAEEEERGGGGDADGDKKATTPYSPWLSQAARELAADYRGARVSLLRRCAEGLEAQAWLLGGRRE